MSVTDQHSTQRDSTQRDSTQRGVHPNGVDPADEPSAEWGWHGTFPRAGPIAGWITVISLFAMLIGNHRGYVEDVYLIIIGTVLAAMLIGHHLKARKAKRR